MPRTATSVKFLWTSSVL